LVTSSQIKRAAERTALLVLPVLYTVVLARAFWRTGTLAFDFRLGVWPAGDRVLHGLTPYGPGAWFVPDPVVGYTYPAPASLLFAATATIPLEVARWLALALAIASPLLALRWCGVRDWRVYGLILYWPPVIDAWQTSNPSIYLVAGTAAVWRLRSRQAAAGAVVAVLISLKFYLWPLGLFFAATRRWSALAYAAVGTLVLNVVAWAVVGFDEFPHFREAVSNFTRDYEDRDLSLIGVVERLGGGRAIAYSVVLAFAALVAAACFRLGRRGREEQSCALAVAVALIATPILSLYYLAILVIPMALLRPRLGPIWFLPLALYVCTASFQAATWQAISTLGVVAASFVLLMRRFRAASVPRSSPRLASVP
jgi:hypothetical protein